MLAGTALIGMPMAAPNQVDEPQTAAAAAAAAAGASVSATAGHCGPDVAPDVVDDDDLTLSLTKSFATATLGTVPPPTRASQQGTAAAAAAKSPSSGGGGRAERQARRRTRLRLVRVPTDYLRAGQESRDRGRRRELVRRCVVRLFSLHEDRASERGISTMMARLTTALEPDAAAVVSAAAPSSEEHAGLAELLEKMAVSKKH